MSPFAGAVVNTISNVAKSSVYSSGCTLPVCDVYTNKFTLCFPSLVKKLNLVFVPSAVCLITSILGLNPSVPPYSLVGV